MATMNTKRQTDLAKEGRKKAGAYIKELRNNAELTQAQLAKLLGYDWYTFVSQVESGANRVPSEAMADWARVLKVDSQEFAKQLLQFYDPYLFKLLFKRGS